MSSLEQDDADKQLRQAVPWVSDPDNRDEQTRRLQEDVIEAAKRLERESGELPAPRTAGASTSIAFRVPVARIRADESTPEDRARKIWAELKPQFVTPQEKSSLSIVTMAAGLFSAMAVSATVALMVVHFVHIPPTGGDLAGEERAPKGDSRIASTLGDLARFSDAQAKMTHPEEPAVAPETLLTSVAPNDNTPPKAPAAAPQQSAKLEPARPEPAAPASGPAPTVNAVPEPRPASPPPQAASPPPQTALPAPQAVSPPPQPASPLPQTASPAPQAASPLPPEEAASLLKRGQDLLAAGDIASARLMLTLVAEAGNAEACVILAGTFDPTVLAKLRAVGVQGDPAKARAWYGRATELGSKEAGQRLQAMR